MMNNLTLPDHISFEEIAAKWCEWREDGSRQLHFQKNSDGIYAFFTLYDDFNEWWTNVARFFFYEKKFEIIDDDYSDDVEFILDFIKERSNV